jgi:peroxiredoxin
LLSFSYTSNRKEEGFDTMMRTAVISLRLSLVIALLPLAGLAVAQTKQPAAPDKATKVPRVAKYRPTGPEATTPAIIPPVVLSKEHEALCRVKVGDKLPEIQLSQLGGSQTAIEKLYGASATVVAFWNADRPMSRTLLADLGPDVVEPFGKQGVAVVTVAVDQPANAARATLEKAQARLPTLIDTGGKAFATVGKERLPRVYLVDPQGKVLWFDIEYSLSTRRELNQALRAVVKAN